MGNAKLVDNGIMAFNDYIQFDCLAGMRYGVVRAVNELIINEDWRVCSFSLRSAMFCHHYGTKTRGERIVPAARPAGEGVCAVLQRGHNLHQTYKLELPAPPGEVQQELNIPPDADGCRRA